MQGAGAWLLAALQHEAVVFLVVLGVVLFYAVRLHLHETSCKGRWESMEQRMDNVESEVRSMKGVVHEVKGEMKGLSAAIMRVLDKLDSK